MPKICPEQSEETAVKLACKTLHLRESTVYYKSFAHIKYCCNQRINQHQFINKQSVFISQSLSIVYV